LTVEAAESFAMAWSFPALPFFSLAITGVVYVRGWRRIRRTRPNAVPPWRAVCFFLGIGWLWIAIASPIDALDDLLLAAHMTQHFILMSVAPPLFALGAPVVPLLRGLPRPVLRGVINPLLRSPSFRKLLEVVKQPVFAWLAMNLAFVGWHVPAAFELALRSEMWHTAEHLCFFATSLAFWWTVIQPWPSNPAWNGWALVPYLVTADIVNTGLSAFLVFSGRVLYPTYAEAPRVFGISALNDQMAAGAGMWFFGSLIFLVAAVGFMFKLLSPSSRVFRAVASF
jgi:cytochrome c oxidase assembly factor CtaG